VLAERVREQSARSPDLVFAARARIRELALELGIRQARQVGMRHRVGAHLEPSLGERSQPVPGERPHLVGVRAGFPGELGDVERPAVGREGGHREDRRGDPEALEDGHGVLGDVLVGVVERDVKKAPAAREHVRGRGRAKPAAKQRRQLALEGSRAYRELVLPPVRDAVVAKDQRA
jgi:hypothetical protein